MGFPLSAVKRPSLPDILNHNHKCMLIQLSSTHNKLIVNVYLATIFGSNFEHIAYTSVLILYIF